MAFLVGLGDLDLILEVVTNQRYGGTMTSCYVFHFFINQHVFMELYHTLGLMPGMTLLRKR